ncbi:photosystem II reaction center Psb28 protein-like [Chenopodium quinoa]|uniref:Photosystem II reaction center Psb28 protein n=1 Tax=Chenopodium quinoa TaxID=63459 RepID=A0A803M961_CHEQI|nr:photosystem II reaction center Psb28 protein-like [Chenopodium quinoa]
MAASLQSLTCSSPLSHCSSHKSSSNPGICVFSLATPQCVHSSFNGLQLRLRPMRWASQRSFSAPVGQIVMMVQPKIQFIQGTDELTIPDVKLTKSKDGTNGAAIFRFDQPSVFDSSKEVGDITGFYMIDEEGVLSSTSVNARFVNGKPAGIEARYIMRTPREWDRFMRFMERYANANGLQFVKS